MPFFPVVPCLDASAAPPSTIQPHGLLLVISEPEMRILQASCNCKQWLGITAQEVIDQPLSALVSEELLQTMMGQLPQGPGVPLTAIALDLSSLPSPLIRPEGSQPESPRPVEENQDQGGDRQHEYPQHYGHGRQEHGRRDDAQHRQVVNVFLHRSSDSLLILEVEPTSPNSENEATFYHAIQGAALQFRQIDSVRAMVQRGTEALHRLIEFDRVMVYRFAPEGHGQVIAESRSPHLPHTFLNHWFPDEDTRSCRSHLAQSRGGARTIVDTTAPEVGLYPELNPQTGAPVNLDQARLRSPNACYRTYLHNMDQVQSTLVIPLMDGPRLWGMISCHHHQPLFVPFPIRQACEFLGRVMSLEVSSRLDRARYDDYRQLHRIQAQLLERMTVTGSLTAGGAHHSLLDLVRATGAVICQGETLEVIGQVPELDQIKSLLAWVEVHCTGDIYATETLSQAYRSAKAFPEVGSGLLVATISRRLKHYILWFRPEAMQVLTWAKRPMVSYPAQDGTERLSPPVSFQVWQEQVRRRSLPWSTVEVDAARDLRHAIVNIVLRQVLEKMKWVDELARSNAELERFARITSHDLQEPLNLASSYIQLLALRYQGQLDADAQEFIGYAVDSIDHMQHLIDDLLDYSRLGGHQNQSFETVPLASVVDWVLCNLQERIQASEAQILVQDLPTVLGNRTQLIQVFQNLLSNALKFRSDRPPIIEIKSIARGSLWEIAIADNGIGLDTQFSDRIFQIFQRLHTREEYPGTGIGLAICQRVVRHHGGEIWVDSVPGQGATFYLTLPLFQ